MNDFASSPPKRPGSHTGAPPAEATAEEGLQLMHAFLKIEDPERRAELIRLAQRLAGRNAQGSR